MAHTLLDHDNECFHYFGQHGDDGFEERVMEKFDEAMSECTTPAELADLFEELLKHGLTGSLDNKAVRAREWAMDELRQFLTGWTDKNREIVAKWAGVES